MLREGYAEVEMEAGPKLANVNKTVHGGAIFSLADTAVGIASKSYGFGSVTLEGKINYLRPIGPESGADQGCGPERTRGEKDGGLCVRGVRWRGGIWRRWGSSLCFCSRTGRWNKRGASSAPLVSFPSPAVPRSPYLCSMESSVRNFFFQVPDLGQADQLVEIGEGDDEIAQIGVGPRPPIIFSRAFFRPMGCGVGGHDGYAAPGVAHLLQLLKGGEGRAAAVPACWRLS